MHLKLNENNGKFDGKRMQFEDNKMSNFVRPLVKMIKKHLVFYLPQNITGWYITSLVQVDIC